MAAPEGAASEGSGGPDVEGRLAEASGELQAASDELDAAVGRALRSAEALVAAEGLTDALLALVDEAVAVLDTDLRVVGWSAGAERRWERSASQTLGRKWSRINRSVDDAVTAKRLDALLLDGAPDSTATLDSLLVHLLGAGDTIHYLLVTPGES